MERINQKVALPNPLNTPTLPLTCSAHRFASSFCWISFTAASAVLTAALAVAKTLPHHPPPVAAGTSSAGWAIGAFFSASCKSLLVAEGVNDVWNDRVLSPDGRGPAAFSSLVRDDCGGPFDGLDARSMRS